MNLQKHSSFLDLVGGEGSLAGFLPCCSSVSGEVVVDPFGDKRNY